MQKIILKQLKTIDEIKNEESYIYDMASDPGKIKVVIKELRNLFLPLSVEDDWKYFFTYWKLYADLANRKLIDFSKEDFINIYIGRQIPSQIFLDTDVWQQIVIYLGLKTPYVVDMANLYVKIKRAFFESEAIIGIVDGKNYIVKDLIKEIKIIYAHGNDSMEVAKLKSKLESLLFIHKEMIDSNIYYDKKKCVGRFIDLIHFFLGVDEDVIFYIVDAFLHPQEYDEDWKAQSQKVSAKSSPVVEEKKAEENTSVTRRVEEKKLVVDVEPIEVKQGEKVEEVSARGGFVDVEEDELFERKEEMNNEVKETSARGGSVNVGKVMTHEQIKEMIESRFNKNENGEFTNAEGVFTLLGALAAEYDDPKILELYYYDEKEGKFKF